jgi:hypothetical protein
MTVEEYLIAIPPVQRQALDLIRATILESMDPSLEECIQYRMLSYVVPHSVFPAGYHCDPTLPLPLASLAAQKNGIHLYHMGLYASPDLSAWWTEQYAIRCRHRLDMGKSCIRFRKYDDIPLSLIAELFAKMNASQWVSLYTSALQK